MPISCWRKWSAAPCAAVNLRTRVTQSELSTPAREHFRGKLDEVRKARKERATANRTTRAQNKRSAVAGQSAALRSIPSTAPDYAAAGTREDGGLPPSWASNLSSSHRLQYAGGAVWCMVCGSQARGPRKDLKLLKACEGKGSNWKASDGRIVRPQRLSEGVCVWDSWPDGRTNHTLLTVRSL